ncbi:MAG TPA: PTS transporter subunit IIC [Atopostipes sp.]|nr:PTS transporter subunit IIC [Atopostipes sp.]
MLDLLINDILSTPSILIGFFVLIGNVLLKKSSTEVISGTFKTIIGFPC